MKKNDIVPKWGDIWMADIQRNPNCASQLYGRRPVLIISDNKGNEVSCCVLSIPVTSKSNKNKRPLPTHVRLHYGEGGLKCESIAECEQIFPLDKKFLIEKLGSIQGNNEVIKKIRKAMKARITLLNNPTDNKFDI